LIDRLEPFAQGWTRTGTQSIQALIQQALDLLFDEESDYLLFVDPEDNKGFPPFLKTKADTFGYDVVAANLSLSSISKKFNGIDTLVQVRRVKRIFIDVSKNNEFGRRWIGQPTFFGFFNPFTNKTTRLQVAEVPIKSEPALEDGTPAKVIFPEDPGTSTDRYFIEFYWSPPKLTSEKITLAIPLKYEQALEDYVLGRINEFANGKTSDRSLKFINFWVPEFRQRVLTANAQLNNRETLPLHLP